MGAPNLDTRLTEYVPGRIWLKKYSVHYAGADFFARTTFIRLNDGRVLVHSPCPIDDALVEQLQIKLADTIDEVLEIAIEGEAAA